MAQPAVSNPFANSGPTAGGVMRNPFSNAGGGAAAGSVSGKITNPFANANSDTNSAPVFPASTIGHASLAVALGNTGAPQVQPQQQGGNWFTNTIHAIGRGAGDMYSEGKAILQGAVGGMAQPGNSAEFGALHPQLEHQMTANQLQQFNNTVDKSHLPGVLKGAAKIGTNLAEGTLTDPLTYVPIGKVAEAAGITPALKFGMDLAKGSVKTGRAAEGARVAAKLPESLTASAAKATTKAPRTMPKLTNAQAKAINDAAGLTGGYEPVKAPVNVTKDVAKLAKPGTIMTQAGRANQHLTALFDAAKKSNLPAGRETETLQDMLASRSGRTGVSLPKLIEQSTVKPNALSAVARAHDMQKFGIAAKDIAPQAFGKTSKSVEREIQSEPNFELRGGQLMVLPKVLEDAAAGAKSGIEPLMQSAKAPYAKYAWQSKVGAPIAEKLTASQQHFLPHGLPGLDKMSKAYDAVFRALPGTTSAFKNAVSQLYGKRSSGANAINTQLKDIFKGTTPAQRKELTHALESTAPGTKLADPKLDAIRQKVEPLMHKAEQQARAKGLLDRSLDLGAMGVQRYLPHIHVDKFDTNGNPVTNGRLLKASIDANKPRSITGTIHDINAKESGPQFEQDALKVFAHHLHSLNNAITAKDLIDTTMKNGINGAEVGDIHPETKTPLVEFPHGEESAMIPKAEADFLTGMNKQAESPLSKAYRGTVNAANHLMFLGNPLMHIANNLGWQTLVHDPGAFKDVVKQLPEALRGVNPGSDMDKALQAGALNLGSEIGTRGSTAKRVDALVKSVDKPAGKLGQLAHGYREFTPNVEKAYRSALFNRAVGRGMNESDAADYVRSILGGHIAPNTMSATERGLSSIMPFFNWTKTAIGSNAKNMLKNPLPYSIVGHGANAMNEVATGHGIVQNSNPQSIAIPGLKNAQGNQVYMTPYFPAWDIAKLAKSIGTEGPGGVLDFGFSRANPLFKTALQLSSREQNPFAPTTQKFNVVKYPYLPIQDSNSGILFGGKGPKINPYLAQASQNVSIPGADYLAPSTGMPTLPNVLARLTGGSLSSPNPQSQSKEKAYAQREAKSELKSYTRSKLRAHG